MSEPLQKERADKGGANTETEHDGGAARRTFAGMDEVRPGVYLARRSTSVFLVGDNDDRDSSKQQEPCRRK
jgi:hypothetical protein